MWEQVGELNRQRVISRLASKFHGKIGINKCLLGVWTEALATLCVISFPSIFSLTGTLLVRPPQRLSNGSLEPSHEASQVVELQDLLEKQNYELAQMKERMSSLSSRVSEVEQELETARKDLIKSEEMNNKYQRDIKEVPAHAHVNTHAQAERSDTSKRARRPIKSLYYHKLFPTPKETGKQMSFSFWKKKMEKNFINKNTKFDKDPDKQRP